MKSQSIKRSLFFLSIVLFCLTLILRFKVAPLLNVDIKLILKWYDFLHTHGVMGLADENFSNYPPAYLYLLWLSTLLPDWVEPIYALKLVPTLFDFLSTFIIFKLARSQYNDDTPYFIAALFFISPTILFNSSGWGQIDSLYTSFLLLCAYLLIKEKPFWGMIAYGIAFSFKAQSIFLLPFLGIMFLKGRIRWYHFLWVPAIYIIFAIPTALIGRSWESILTIYIGQINQFQSLSKDAPNPYIFISNSYYHTGVLIGLGIFVLGLSIWGWVNWHSKITLTPPQILMMALAELCLVPFLLPKMLNRYFYPADVFSFATAIVMPELWFVPLLYQLISSLSYSPFLVGMPVAAVKLAALINTGAVIYVLRKQFLMTKN